SRTRRRPAEKSGISTKPSKPPRAMTFRRFQFPLISPKIERMRPIYAKLTACVLAATFFAAAPTRPASKPTVSPYTRGTNYLNGSGGAAKDYAKALAAFRAAADAGDAEAMCQVGLMYDDALGV